MKKKFFKTSFYHEDRKEIIPITCELTLSNDLDDGDKLKKRIPEHKCSIQFNTYHSDTKEQIFIKNTGDLFFLFLSHIWTSIPDTPAETYEEQRNYFKWDLELDND